MAFRHRTLSNLVMAVALMSSTVSAHAANDDSIYRQALQLARTDKLDQATSILQSLVEKYPQILRYRYDYIQVLGWNGRNRAVVEQSRQLDLSVAPPYVVATLARAQRNLGHFEQTESLYAQLLLKQPDDVGFKLGLAGVLIDQKKLAQAQAILAPLLRNEPSNIDVLMTHAYAAETGEDYLAALASYQKILELQPGHQAAIRGLVLSMSANKAFLMAYETAQQHRNLFTDEEWVKLNWDRAATYVRWGEVPVKHERDRFIETDRGISLIEANLRMLDALPLADKATWRRKAYFDLMVALRDRKRMYEVRELYQTLSEEQAAVPAYAKIAAADALLYLQHPDQARDLYLDVLRDIPNSFNAQFSLVSAYVETEQFELSQALADQLAQQQPEKLWFKSPKDKRILYSRGNPKKTTTELSTAVVAAFADRLEDAYQKVDTLYKDASYNADLRSTYAHIDLYRGWPRQSKQLLLTGLDIDPQHLGLRTGLSQAYHELAEYPEEDQNTRILYQQYPEDKGIQRQKRLWDIHNMRELKVFTDGGFSSGSALGSESVSLDSFLYSRPMDYYYRLFTHFRWQGGKFIEGNGDFQRYGLGLEYKIRDWLASGEIHYDRFDQSALGVALNLDHQFDDHWSIALDFDTHSDNIALRGFKSGITAWGEQLTLTYRVHESRQFSINQQYFNYSDNNNRYAVAATYYERWLSGPIYKFSTYLNMGYSHNAQTDVPYFSPANDVSTSVTLDHDILTYRHYDLSFHQRIAMTFGNYWQDGFDSNIVGQVLYEHRWKAHDRYELIYGGIFGKPVYDGIREDAWRFYLNLNVRF